MKRHVVLGSGPVGTGIALALADRGERVDVITRSGSGPDHPLITRSTADAADTDAVTRAAEGAATVFNCANPPYHRWPTDWPPVHQSIMSAAERTGAGVVMMDNLYALGPGSPMPMRENHPLTAAGPKGSTRARMANELLAASSSGRLRATLARASDFYGPGVVNSSLGERVLPKVLKGEAVSVLGRIDQPHSMSYMPDVVRTMVALADDDRSWGHAWQVPNAPALTQQQMVEALAHAAGTSVKVKVVPALALRMLGLFNPAIRELRETAYQFDGPWVTDSGHTEATFGLSATPVEQAAAATIEWWRSR